MENQLPFVGLNVLDIASYIAGPAATTMLADLGASVIKVEPPDTGDPYRQAHVTPPHPPCETDYAWQLTNRNKRGIAVDLKHPDGQAVLARLVERADVLVTNFPQPVRVALGLDREAIGRLNPRLVYADVTGYGSRGADADRPGFDVTAFWARTGHMHATHDVDGPPALPIPGIGDHATACTLFGAIVTALYTRDRTGRGAHVTTSLMAQGAWSAGLWLEAAMHGAEFFPQQSRKRPANPLINSYRTADDRWLILVAMQERHWQKLALAIGRPELAQDARFGDARARAAHAEALTGILETAFADRPLVQWEAMLGAAQLNFSVVREVHEVAADPQLLLNDVLTPLARPVGHATHTVNSPVQIAGLGKVPPQRAPDIGEHTEEVLRELGFAPAFMAKMRREGTARSTAAPPVRPVA